MQITVAANAPDYYDARNPSARSGNNGDKLLLSGREGSPSNFKLTLGSVVSEYSTPRHRHNFEQIRYPLNGDYGYAKDKVIPCGWVGYFTEGVYYGPQLQKQSLALINLQFGGPSGHGYLSKHQRQEAYAALTARGKFEKGVFTWYDETGQRHNKDSYEALWEQASGRPVSYPQPRYDDCIIMNPGSYKWIPVAPGVAVRWLGTFTEGETRIGFMRLEAGSHTVIEPRSASEIVFVTQGSVVHDGTVYPTHTAFEIEVSDGAVAISGHDDAEFLRVRLPVVASLVN
jgi:hypothetical protein